MEMGIEYLLIGMQTDAHFITYILIVSLALQIPYYDKKGLRRTSIGLGILYMKMRRSVRRKYVTMLCHMYMLMVFSALRLRE